MRVLYVSNLYPPHVEGGAELLVSYLAELAAEHGHDVLVVTTKPRGLPRTGVEARNGVRVVRFFPWNIYGLLDRPRGAFSLPLKLLWHAWDAWNVHAGSVFARVLASEKPDIVHTHNITGFSPVVWRVAKQSGIPVVHTAHDFHLVCPRGTLLRSSGSICENPPWPCIFYRRYYVRRASALDAFCAPSKFHLELHRSMGVKARRFDLVRNGIPPVMDKPAQSQAGEELHLLYMAQLAHHKGIDTLLKAFQEVPHTSRLRLRVAGKGPLEGMVKAAAAQDERIAHNGFVQGEAKACLLGDSDFLVIASRCLENAPISILEAYSHGLGVLGSSVGGIPELVREGESGYLFRPGDHEQLAAVIRRLLVDRETVMHTRQKARELAEEYTAEKMYLEYAKIYMEVLGAGAG